MLLALGFAISALQVILVSDFPPIPQRESPRDPCPTLLTTKAIEQVPQGNIS